MTLPIPNNGWGQLWLFVGSFIALAIWGFIFNACMKAENEAPGKFTFGVLALGAVFYSGYLQGLQSEILRACRLG